MTAHYTAVIKEFLKNKIRLVADISKRENLVEGYRISILLVAALKFYKKYWKLDLLELYPELIAAQPAHQLAISMVSSQLAYQDMHEAAVAVATTVTAFNTPGNVFPLLQAAALRELGELQAARNVAKNLLEIEPNDTDAISELAQCDVEELFLKSDYYDVLHMIHQHRKPETYLEIGVAQGRSLALAHSGTTSIGVDPDTGSPERIFFHSPENTPRLFRMTSDEFFASFNLAELFEKSTIDVAFLDGLHHFDQTLKDFINVEKYAQPDSLVLIHDCLPVNALVAERQRHTGFWLGDVWKLIPCLKAIRPDLDIVTLPVKPSGLAVIRNLDPSSRILERQLESITEHFNALVLPESWEEKCKLCCVTDQSPESLFGISEAA
jgi:predicted O-methyltransferase YrrM